MTPAEPTLFVRTAAVLGAGVMGAQIAAHLANAGIACLLFELAAPGGPPGAASTRAIEGLAKMDPAPLALPALAGAITPLDYDHHLERLGECDLVVEAIAERLDWKQALYARIAPALSPHAVLATNTSGLSVEALAAGLAPALRRRFCGVHFFNPPRYMHLVELVPVADTDPAVLDGLEAFLTTVLGKGVVRALDTPNFIANRVGVFSMLAACHHAARLGLGFDAVDAVTGSRIGRPRTATFRTADLVGLDVLGHVIGTMQSGLADDPWHRYFAVPDWMATLVAGGALGSKTGRGIYRKGPDGLQVLDVATGSYRSALRDPDPAVADLLKERDPAARLAALRASDRPQARFLWAVTRDMLHYCAVQLEHIASNARDLDLALRWGFAWKEGPFELWQAAGWQSVARWIAEDIEAGHAMAAVPLPAWALAQERTGVHGPEGSFSPRAGAPRPRSSLAVYRRQPVPDRLLGEGGEAGTTLLETDAVRLWSDGDDIGVLSFKSKMHAIGEDVLEGVALAVERAERDLRGLVIWQTEPPFSVGANLSGPSAPRADRPRPSAFGAMVKKLRRQAESAILEAARKLNVADALMAGRLERVEAIVEQFQATSMLLRYCRVPTVAAVDGMALGGGCEFVMHCDRAVATLESYIGLVETGVGLVPAGGGCKELVLRAAAEARGGDIFAALRPRYQNAAMAEVSRSALLAREMGYLRASDPIVMHRRELLHVARHELVALSERGYRPPLPARDIVVGGRTALGTIRAQLANLLAGGTISEHDHLVATQLARVMCGGDVDAGVCVDERWLLDLERQAFMALLATAKTQARIEHTLKTGKPLRN